jgi:prophage tail gpP-like protein
MKVIFELLIDNTKIFRKEFISFQSSLDSIVHELSIDLYDKDFVCKLGSTCEARIDYNGNKVQFFSGYVTTLKRSYSDSGTLTSITCESKCVDLVESSALLKRSFVRKTFIDLLKVILDPFGIQLESSISSNPVIAKFNFQTNETAFEAIERLCRFYAVLPKQLPNGNLSIENSSEASTSVYNFYIGQKGILSIDYTESSSDINSEYIGLSQYSGQGKAWTNSVVSTEAKAYDVSLSRYRPKLFIAEGRLARKTLRERVYWEAQVRNGRGKSLQIVSTIVFNNNSFWKLGDLVTFTDQQNRHSLWILSELDLSQGDQGTQTRLTFVPPGTYSANPSEQVSLTK